MSTAVETAAPVRLTEGAKKEVQKLKKIILKN